ncbi:MAG TPA: glycosyltransferase [Anaerolineales bacterium]|nr:glycosyltransferase [Anaerolineales bacterium]
MKRKVALISEHASPLTVLDSMDRVGHNVYVAQVAQHLARLGYLVDVFTRKDSWDLPETYQWLDNLRVIHVPAGPSTYVRDEKLHEYMKEFSEYLIEFFSRQEKPYDLIHANFWRSGWAAAEIKANLGTPFVITFHTLGSLWQRQPKSSDETAGQRLAIENRVVREADGIIARCSQDRQDLISLYDADPTYIAQIPEGFPAEQLSANPSEALQPGGCADDEIRWYQRLFAWQNSASLLTDFYENVLAVRRVSIPMAEPSPLVVGDYEYQTPPGIVEHVLETALQTLREPREQLGERLLAAANLMNACLERGGKIMVCGDGSAASLAQQFAVELIKSFSSTEYSGLPVLLLTAADASLKHSLDEMSCGKGFASQVEAVGQAGDLLIGIAASDSSANLVEAFRCARANGIPCLSLGSGESETVPASDVALVIHTSNPQRMSELQLIILHLLCELLHASIHDVQHSQISVEHLNNARRAITMQHDW